MNRAKRARQLQAAVRHILLRDWNPLALGSDLLPRDEYDSFSGGRDRLPVSGVSAIGLPPHPRQIANRKTHGAWTDQSRRLSLFREVPMMRTVVCALAVGFCITLVSPQVLTAQSNTPVGAEALQNNTTGIENTGVGFRALRSNTTGSDNTATGLEALRANTNGSYNTAAGTNSLAFNKSGRFNVATGSAALMFNTSGSDNTAIGTEALSLNSTGFWNAAIGDQALFSNTGPPIGSIVFDGCGNTATGHMALFSNVTGHGNVATGLEALSSNTTASNSTAVGNGALFYNTTGESNTAIGVAALLYNSTGETNTAVGRYALADITTGSGNTAIGLFAGGLSATTNSSFIGTGASAFTVVNNSSALGSGANVTADNQVRIGNTLVTSIGGQVNFTAFSDGRYKRNVSENVPGLAFIAKLRPITYTVDVEGLAKRLKAMRPPRPTPAAPSAVAATARSLHGDVRAGDRASLRLPAEEVEAREETVEERRANQERARIVYTGFVAQEVEQAAKDVNYQFSGVDGPKSKDDFYGLRYAEFVVPLVKAVQELTAENKQVKKELSELKKVVDKLMKERR